MGAGAGAGSAGQTWAPSCRVPRCTPLALPFPACPAGGHLDAVAGSKAYSHAAAPLAHGLQVDSEAAAARVQDACRAMLQVVWLARCGVPRAQLEDLL